MRSGRKIQQPSLPISHKEAVESSKDQEQGIASKDEASKNQSKQSQRIIIRPSDYAHLTLPPFPSALRGKKKKSDDAYILKVLKQVKVNIPLLDMIKQVPTYATFIKDSCTMTKGLNIVKNAFLTKQVSTMIENKIMVKHKDLGFPTILVTIRESHMEKALLDLRASVNILPYLVYKQIGLGYLKPTNITLFSANKSIKKPRDIVDDILVQVDIFNNPVDLVVLDREQSTKGIKNAPTNLGMLSLATSNSLINCRNDFMQLTFGNMTMVDTRLPWIDATHNRILSWISL